METTSIDHRTTTAVPSPPREVKTAPPDPYVQWFHITAEQRPLSPYELLGIAELEEDRRIIGAAVQRRRNELEAQRAQADADVWSDVAREVEAAAETLSTPDLKAMLDASIRRRQRAAGVGTATRKRLETPEKLVCQACSQENTGGRRFCARCGQTLWRVCGRCDIECPAMESYCGGCGTNLVEAEQRLITAQEALLRQAQQRFAAGRFEEALKTLLPLAVHEDPRLEPLIQQATKWIHEWRAQANAWRQRVEDELARAEACLLESDYDQALQILTHVPEEFRDDRIRRAIVKAETLAHEIRELEAQIRQAVERKAIAGLGGLIDRMLELRPQHPEVRKLALRLVKPIEQAVDTKIRSGHYQRALELLDELPKIARGERYSQLYDQIVELRFLRDNVAESPAADTATLVIAERLVKASPTDKQAAEWLRVLRELRAAGKSELPWRTGTDCSPSGFQVRCWPLWRAIKVAPSASQSLQGEATGLWNVACGLALQGLGRSRIRLNLAKQEKRDNVFRALVGRRSTSVRSAWGLDIGNTSLKAIELALDERDQVTVTRAHQVTWSKPLHRPEAATERAAILAHELSAFVKRFRIVETDRVCAALPLQATLVRSQRVPAAPDKKLRAAIALEARHQFPIPLEQLAWDYEVWDDASTEGGSAAIGRQPHAVLAAARRELVESWQRELESTGLRVAILQSSALAQYNLAAFEQYWPPLSPVAEGPEKGVVEDGTAVLDIGAAGTCLTIGSPSFVWCRTLPISGDSFTEALLRNLKLTYSQAEQLKCEPFRAKVLSRLYQNFDPLLHELVRETRRSIDAFHKDTPGCRVRQLVLYGGGSRLHGLTRFLLSEC